VALADIISKIESDAEAEAASIRTAAQDRADGILTAAEQLADQQRAHTVAEADADAHREAARIVVSAKLAARDDALAQRRQLVDAALERTAAALAAASDVEYAGFLSRRIAAVARGGETLHFGSADIGRAEAIVESLRMNAPELKLSISTEPAPFDRGVLVEGARVRADLSLTAVVEEHRDELELVAADVLFGEGA